MTSLLGIQIPAPERAAEPPNVGAFSTTTTLSPRLAAVSAAVIPAAPEPTTTTSYSPSSGAAPAAGAVASPDVTARPTPAAVPRRIWRRVRSAASMALSSFAVQRRHDLHTGVELKHVLPAWSSVEQPRSAGGANR